MSEFKPSSNAPGLIVKTCEDMWEEQKSNCSGFAIAVSSHFGIPLTGNADRIVADIQGAGWISIANGLAAKHAADAGWFVIAALAGARHHPPRQHGHVVVVVTGDAAHGKYPTAYWGSIGSIGSKRKALNYAWNTSDRDRIIYAYCMCPIG